MLLENPSVLIKNGKHFMTMNANDHKSVMQNDMPNSFKCSGSSSEITKNGNVKTAHDAMNITNENDTKGIKLNDSTE